MRVFVFGSSLTSSYWNGAATYYRGIYKNLADMGFDITFAEPDAFGRQQHRDNEDFSYAEVIVYQSPGDIPSLIRRASECDLVIKHSGVGVHDAMLEERVLECRSGHTQVAFWDVDAPATLAAVEANALHPMRGHIPEYDYIFTYGGGAAGGRALPQAGRSRLSPHLQCPRSRNALSGSGRSRVEMRSRFCWQSSCRIAKNGSRSSSWRPLSLPRSSNFILGGEGWGGKALPR